MHSSDNYKIAPIHYSDYINLIQLFRDFHAESYAKDLINFDPDVTIEFLNEMMDDPDLNFAVKCSLKDEIVGFYMGSISTMSFSSTKIGFERGFYVKSESRKGRAATMLKQAWYDWLNKKKTKITIATIYHSADNELTYQFCKKMGMRKIGEVYERVL